VFFTALEHIPPGSLPRVRLLHEPAVNNLLDVTPSNDCMTIGAGLLPVPSKLVCRIVAEEYIDMAELLPDRLGVARSPGTEESAKIIRKRRTVSNIMEWVQCFGIYLAVISHKQP